MSLYRKLIPVDSLTCENVLYWRALCEFVKSKGNEGEELLEQLLPEAAIFAEYLYRWLCSTIVFLVTLLNELIQFLPHLISSPFEFSLTLNICKKNPAK